MKYLKTFETISNSIFNVDVFKRSFGITPDELEDFFVEMVDDLDLNAKVIWDRSINAAIIKIDVPVEGRPRLHEWFSENIKPKLGRIKTQLKNNFGLDYSGYQLGLSSETNFHYKLIWYKSSDLPSGKRNESFGGFQLDEISEEKYKSLLTEEYPIDYRKSVEIYSRLPDGFDRSFGYSYLTIVGEDEENPTVVKSYYITKYRVEGDDPYYTLLYEIENHSPADDEERLKQYFFTFEEDDYDEICNDPKILIDYLNREL